MKYLVPISFRYNECLTAVSDWHDWSVREVMEVSDGLELWKWNSD